MLFPSHDPTRKAKTEAIKAELEMGLISRVEAYKRLNPDMQDEAEILEHLINASRLEGIVARVVRAEESTPNELN